MKFSVHQISRLGGRKGNEDRLGYAYTRSAVLLVLADGMGGHPEGEKAAEIACHEFARQFEAQAQPRLPSVEAFLSRALEAANRAIMAYAAAAGMVDDNPRTTVVAAVVQDGLLCAVHSGDSRLYWARQGRLLSRTTDHSYHEQAALLKQAPAQVNRSVLFTCLGTPATPIYDVMAPVPLVDGDRILLCSDGLWANTSDSEICAGLCGQPLTDAVTQLANQAVRKGGRHGDNVSVLALEWEGVLDFGSAQVIETDEQGGPKHASSFHEAADTDARDALLDDLDEDAIERSIAEIEAALLRTQLPKSKT